MPDCWPVAKVAQVQPVSPEPGKLALLERQSAEVRLVAETAAVLAVVVAVVVVAVGRRIGRQSPNPAAIGATGSSGAG